MIVAHYMPWFEAKPARPNWGWHWTMNAFDPEKVTGAKRQIASQYYPQIGPYDSGDPAVIEYHLLLMKLAGIEGLIVDWYGRSDLFDYPILHRNTAALFPVARRLGLKIAICYEDQTIPKRVEAKKLPENERVAGARQEIAWLRKNWFADPAYLRLRGKPVLLSFGASGLSDDEWEKVLEPGQGALLYFSEHRRRSVAAGAFDWPVPREGLAAVDRFYTQAREWPISVPVAFPRFHDIYGEAKVHESWGRIDDENGRTFTTTLERALKSGAPLVQIATWNDWGEGTVIEPSVEFGYRDLETVQRLRRTLVDPGFAATSDDLRQPHRLLRQRQRLDRSPRLDRDLDAIARLLAAGAGKAARAALARCE